MTLTFVSNASNDRVTEVTVGRVHWQWLLLLDCDRFDRDRNVLDLFNHDMLLDSRIAAKLLKRVRVGKRGMRGGAGDIGLEAFLIEVEIWTVSASISDRIARDRVTVNDNMDWISPLD